jgi:hypothetical protein
MDNMDIKQKVKTSYIEVNAEALAEFTRKWEAEKMKRNEYEFLAEVYKPPTPTQENV